MEQVGRRCLRHRRRREARRRRLLLAARPGRRRHQRGRPPARDDGGRARWSITRRSPRRRWSDARDDGPGDAAFVTLKEGANARMEPKELIDDLRHVVKKIGAIARPDDILFTADLPKTIGQDHAAPAARYRQKARRSAIRRRWRIRRSSPGSRRTTKRIWSVGRLGVRGRDVRLLRGEAG